MESASRDRGSMGAWLRTQREARGVSVEEIARASKISVRHLEAIESDRFDALPAPVFVRGFLREYARVVGLDGDEVVNLYLSAKPAAPPARDELRRAAAATPRAGRSPLLGYALVVGGLLVIFLGIAAAIWAWSSRGGAPAAAAGEGPAAEATPGEVTSAAPAASPAGGDSAAEVALPEAPLPVPEGLQPEPAAGAAPAAVAPREVSGPLRVVLEFQQDCWVEVVVDGRRRASELKAGGETLALEAQQEILLTLGNAPAVRVEVDGRPVTLPIAGSRVMRELRIDRQGISALPAAAPAGES